MSMNRLIRQSLSLFEEAVGMPFQLIRRTWGDQSSVTGQTIRQMSNLAEGMASMPIRFARDFFVDDASKGTVYSVESTFINQSGQTTTGNAGQPDASQAQQPQ